MNRAKCRSEEGSLLLSTFHLLFFVSFLILSLTGIIYNQMMQLQQFSQAYEAKALIEMSEAVLQDKLEWEDVEKGTVYFTQGKVDIEKVSDTEYELSARLNNNYTSSQNVIIPLPTKPEESGALLENQGADVPPLIEADSETIQSDEENEIIEPKLPSEIE